MVETEGEGEVDDDGREVEEGSTDGTVGRVGSELAAGDPIEPGRGNVCTASL